MRCEQAGNLMMKYMDSLLSEKEAEKLNLHLLDCADCRADFHAYDQMVEIFAEEASDNLESALPDLFEQETMAMIEALGVLPNHYTKTDNLLCMLWGGFSVLIGLGFGIALNKDAIGSLLADSPEGLQILRFFEPVSASVSSAANGVATAVSQGMAQAAGYVSASRWVLLVVFSCLAVTYFLVDRKKKMEIS